MRSKHLALCCAFYLAAAPATAEALRDVSTPLLAQAEAEPTRAAPPQIQNVQRLLKLLADRYPKKYGSVDPGRVDGSFGAETKDAIRNFQRISGSKSSAQNGDQLVADILATLAQMSATQAADTGIESAPKAAPPAAANPAPQVAAAPPAEAPKAAAPKIEAPAAEPPQPAAPKPDVATPPAPTAEPKNVPADPPKAAKPKPAPAQAAAKGQRVFFVQAASLKSLESAKREWRKIFEENRAALTGEQVYFEKANVGDRGLFFRILIGPMNERDAAKTLCSFLQQNGQTCVVTSRDSAEPQKTASQAGATETSAAADRNGRSVATAPAPERTKAAATEAPAATEASPASTVPAVDKPIAAQDKGQPPAPPANGPDQGSPQGQIAAAPPAPAASEPADDPKEPEPQVPGPSAGVTAAPNAGSVEAAHPAPANAQPQAAAPAQEPSPADSPQTAAPPPVSDPPRQAESQAQPEPKPAAAGGATASRSSTAMDAAHAVVTRLSQQPDKVAGIAAALIIATGIAVYGWRRRNRRLSLSQLFQSANLPISRAPSESAGPMDDIETDFGSDSLQQSRLARDTFLRDTLGAETGEENTSPSDDSAMRINSSLKALLVKEPAQYKSIFLNWIFLAKVGSALNNKEISFEQLSDHISREFDLLQTYFKIHLLELDDRHRIRQELPGLFYCLQLTQMKKRQNSAKFSAA